MSIQQVRLINSIGRFRAASASGDVTFKKFTLIFGENGRGKTTLCAILRSLQTNAPEIIEGRKTLSSTNKPMVRIAMNSGTAVFADSAGKSPETRIRIFDAQYIADNIYSGDAIGTDQRRNLCRVVLGQNGVELARKYDQCDAGINAKNAEIRTARATLTQYVHTSQISDFIELQADPDIDAKIETKAPEVAGLKESDKLRTRADLDSIELPPLPTNLATMLESTLEDVSRAAEQAVRKHLASHHIAGDESWLSDGMELMSGDTCPFCGQSTKGLDLIEAYRAFFNAEYQKFCSKITRYKATSEQLLSDDRIDLALSRLAGNESNAEVWAQYVSIKRPALDKKANIKESMTAFRDILLDLCAKKVASPLDRVTVPRAYHTAYSAFEATKKLVDDYNEHVKAANALIAGYKKTASAAQTQAAEKQLAGLRLIKKRHEPEIAAGCTLYSKLTAEKDELDRQKAEARDALDTYSTDVLTRYRNYINANLRKFSAGFHIGEVRVEYTGRVPNSTFCFIINDTLVEMGNAETPINQPSFKNTLSAGDRSTLALAFFMAEIAEDPNKADTIVVFDDPFNSQDHYRRTCTITEIRRSGNNVGQVVVMSHDRHFLRETHIRRIAPTEMEGASTLGAMLGRIRENEQVPQALKLAYDDIDDINTYTRQYMHGDPNYVQGKRLSSDELAGFVEKVLLIVGH